MPELSTNDSLGLLVVTHRPLAAPGKMLVAHNKCNLHEPNMGFIYADIELVNPSDLALVRRGYLKAEDVRRERVRALVDSGAYMLCINEHLRTQLDLPTVTSAEAELADGTRKRVDVVGPVMINFQNRTTSCNAAVLPGENEVLLGAIPMEDLDVVLVPKEQTIAVNPDSPYLAKKKIK